MARPRDTRSRSPAGKSWGDRHGRYNGGPRDDRGSYRGRSRTPERRRDVRNGRRDRSPDRQNDRLNSNSHRPDRHARSPVRDRRDRHRDRDYREHSRDREYRRDDSRERNRRRRDDSTDNRKGHRNRDMSRNRDRDRARDETPGSRASESNPTVKQADDAKRQAERLAKVEQWKAKQRAEQERKQKEQVIPGGTRGLLEEMDRKAAATASAEATPAPSLPDDPELSQKASPVPLKRFDPKAIVKKSSGPTTGSTALGDDVSIPEAHKTRPPPLQRAFPVASTKGKIMKPSGKLNAFGITNKQSDIDKADSKRAIDFDDEESTQKKLERLPTSATAMLGADQDVEHANVEPEVDDDEDITFDAGNEEEVAAAARLAAERREERLQQQEEDSKTDVANASADAVMTEALVADAAVIDVVEEEEEDPLDAFMKTMSTKAQQAEMKSLSKPKILAKKRKQEPEAFFGDEGEDQEAFGVKEDDLLAMAHKRAKKKEMAVVNHEKMSYEPFRKNFYVPPGELADLTPEEIADIRLELDGIKVKGTDVPAPVQKWAQCGLGMQTLGVISSLGYEKPSSIQAQAIPAIMSGRDVIGVAKTGSGKTVAFMLPMFRHIKDQRPLGGMDGPVGLIIAPTRELATQIHRDCKPFLKALDLRAVCTYGGAPIKDQIADLKRGAEIIVCTTGRIIELLAANQGRVTNLARVTYVVLDEADRMFDMGFEPQIMKILNNIRPDRQTVLFSATFPRQMESLARKVLNRPIEIQVGGRSVVAPEITQVVEVREEATKFRRLLELLGELYVDDDDVRTLIFVERQESADSLLKELMRKGYPCMSIHGGKDQIDRDSTIDDFKKGIFPIMIATSVAARGLDVKQLKLVVNFDCPNHLEDYVHRVGRTGRAGNTGTAVTFLTPEQDRYAVDISKALTQSGQEVPDDVKKLADSFREKVKSGEEKTHGRGFGGRGIDKYDELRDATKQRERQAYKTGDEPDEQDDEADKKLDEEIAAKTKGTPIVASAKAQAQAQPPAAPLHEHHGLIDLDNVIIHKTEKPESTPRGSGNPLDKVRAAADKVNNRLSKRGTIFPGQPIDNRGPDAGLYHTTININDFPQKARWAVTNRTNVAKILDATGTSITTKGNFYAAGKEPEEGEAPKLYILIEGDTEMQVKGAVAELDRLLKEGTIAAATTALRAPASGRYSVV
ncbi:P-loop containing nucleoside triphosphate hydrolase protein [Pseudovirgaria hyperparasitica]|uniref:RNA helicase n=1 Tax=Pseudovirgaria hyperparasitica TaxID=470096 RepID=A0A6A6WJX5_9PEZI|nr:P-loop containing nucleoside triphosphate hydrolase protein [Pseudovirgaria hyperparasitica]KAF2761871.1 P-loop containing nucleoside triphosphate hydrolase protein [Pseudovirgaria hyperparasitica]